LLVIPIEQSLLYIEPIYLRAEQGELPELKRVIVAYNKNVVMEETLEALLDKIFGNAQLSKQVFGVPFEQFTTQAKQALETQTKAEAAARQGNWADYGRFQTELRDILLKLNQGNQKN
jgi:uncharacterized protein